MKDTSPISYCIYILHPRLFSLPRKHVNEIVNIVVSSLLDNNVKYNTIPLPPSPETSNEQYPYNIKISITKDSNNILLKHESATITVQDIIYDTSLYMTGLIPQNYYDVYNHTRFHYIYHKQEFLFLEHIFHHSSAYYDILLVNFGLQKVIELLLSYSIGLSASQLAFSTNKQLKFISKIKIQHCFKRDTFFCLTDNCNVTSQNILLNNQLALQYSSYFDKESFALIKATINKKSPKNNIIDINNILFLDSVTDIKSLSEFRKNIGVKSWLELLLISHNMSISNTSLVNNYLELVTILMPNLVSSLIILDASHNNSETEFHYLSVNNIINFSFTTLSAHTTKALSEELSKEKGGFSIYFTNTNCNDSRKKTHTILNDLTNSLHYYKSINRRYPSLVFDASLLLEYKISKNALDSHTEHPLLGNIDAIIPPREQPELVTHTDDTQYFLSRAILHNYSSWAQSQNNESIIKTIPKYYELICSPSIKEKIESIYCGLFKLAFITIPTKKVVSSLLDQSIIMVRPLCSEEIYYRDNEKDYFVRADNITFDMILRLDNNSEE